MNFFIATIFISVIPTFVSLAFMILGILKTVRIV